MYAHFLRESKEPPMLTWTHLAAKLEPPPFAERHPRALAPLQAERAPPAAEPAPAAASARSTPPQACGISEREGQRGREREREREKIEKEKEEK